MKNDRQAALLRLIEEQVIETQEKLQSELKALGFNVTQATVSRDIKALKIVKALDGMGNYRYTVGAHHKEDNSSRYTEIFKKSVVSIRSAVNDVVIKCFTGTANAACAAIDELYSDMFVGTLAGDDTILIITSSADAALLLVEKLNEVLGKNATDSSLRS